MLVCGFGIFTCYYDVNAVNSTRTILNINYPVDCPVDAHGCTNKTSALWKDSKHKHGPYYPGCCFNTSWQNAFVTASTLIGMVIGMLILGALSDRFGRRELMLMTSTVSFFGSLLATCAWNESGTGNSIWGVIIAGRLLLGVGIGGELPLCASHAAEAAEFDDSGFQLALVLVWEGVGLVIALVVTYFCLMAACSDTNAYKPFGQCGLFTATPGVGSGWSSELEFVWRFTYGFGAFLSLLGLSTRWFFLRNTEKFERAGRKKFDVNEVMATIKEYWRPLTSTCLGWTIYGAMSYGVGMYAIDFVMKLKPGNLFETIADVLIIESLSMPGFIVAFYIQEIGRKRALCLGCLGQAACFAALAFNSVRGTTYLSLSLFTLQMLLVWAGPMIAYFSIGAEIYPTAKRATLHGISCAGGKVGATIFTFCFPLILNEEGLGNCFAILTGMSLLVFAISYYFTPSYNSRTLQHLEEAESKGKAIMLLYEPEKYFQELHRDTYAGIALSEKA